jgi:hypothetical protein
MNPVANAPETTRFQLKRPVREAVFGAKFKRDLHRAGMQGHLPPMVWGENQRDEPAAATKAV